MHATDQERMATCLAEVRGHDGHLPDVTCLDNENVAFAQMYPRTCGVPVAFYVERVAREIDHAALDVESLDVPHALIAEDVSSWPDVPVRQLPEGATQQS